MIPLQNKGPSPYLVQSSVRALSVPGYSSQTSYLISPSSSLSALPSYTQHGLLCSYSNSNPISSLFVSWCFLPLLIFSFNCGKNVFNFGLLPNSWHSPTIFPWHAKHYSLHSLFGHFEVFVLGFPLESMLLIYVRIGKVNWLNMFLFSDNENLLLIA